MEVLISNCEDPFVVAAGMVGQWCEAEMVKENVRVNPTSEECHAMEDQYEAVSPIDGDTWWVSDRHISDMRERNEAGMWVEL